MFKTPLSALALATISAAMSPSVQAQGIVDSVPYLTVRNVNPNESPKKYYGKTRGPLSAGFCDVTRSENSFLKPLAEIAPFYIPEDDVELSTIRLFEMDQVIETLKETTGARNPLLYTHGYYMNFERSCKRAVHLQRNVGLEGKVMLFSWPSAGDILNYTEDVSDVEWSSYEYERTVRRLVEEFGEGRVDLASHSLGGRALFNALRSMAHERIGMPPLLNNVILLAPDVDAELFALYLDQIRPLANRITLYATDTDRPLSLSRSVNGYPRLGELGPHLNRMDGIEIIDISELSLQSVSGHVYHLYNPEVGRDLSQLLNEGKSAASRSGLEQVSTTMWKLRADVKP
ncbi:alpha/beta hydrolase [Halocynthiibacter sp. C4]|uniref:alpha/beta hydrolase n=1 Tax=Halocynthiibacter sp. C4 TaxID=2992758 RepID=UPI00237B472D|nr:alpha/beta hydrolase [Halocynthiibacter sp. C4]MDE0590600.1 alpha/beta hydrolase [Halocynthiibacter sp. C4]